MLIGSRSTETSSFLLSNAICVPQKCAANRNTIRTLQAPELPGRAFNFSILLGNNMETRSPRCSQDLGFTGINTILLRRKKVLNIDKLFIGLTQATYQKHIYIYIAYWRTTHRIAFLPSYQIIPIYIIIYHSYIYIYATIDS